MASLQHIYEPKARAAAKRYGVDPDVFVRQIGLESDGWASDVIRGQRDSPAGARGIAQLMPGTARDLGVNPLDPEAALDAGARYMSQLLGMFGGDYNLALAGYNAGPGRVQNLVQTRGQGWMVGLPGETKRYLSALAPSGVGGRTVRQEVPDPEDDLIARAEGRIAGGGDRRTRWPGPGGLIFDEEQGWMIKGPASGRGGAQLRPATITEINRAFYDDPMARDRMAQDAEQFYAGLGQRQVESDRDYELGLGRLGLDARGYDLEGRGLDIREQEGKEERAQRSREYLSNLSLEMQRIGMDMQDAEREERADAENMRFLREKFAFEQEQGQRSHALETQRMAETVQARMEQNAIARERMQFEMQQYQSELQRAQAEMDFTAERENVQNRMQAEQVNESRRQANLQQRQGVARDIADFSKAPGDVGALASFLLAGGASPISSAMGQGQSAITDESLLPLDLLLQNRDELNKGPQLLEPGLVTAPRIAPFGEGFMGINRPTPIESVERPEDAAAAQARGAARQQGLFDQVMTFLMQGGASGPTKGGETDRRLKEFQAAGYLKQDEAGNFVKAADGFEGLVSEPTLFLAGEEGPEDVKVTPKKQGKGFLDEAFELALARSPWKGQQNPTPIGVSAPGTSPWVISLAAALAGLGQGIAPSLFLQEAAALRPQGAYGGPLRRTR